MKYPAQFSSFVVAIKAIEVVTANHSISQNVREKNLWHRNPSIGNLPIDWKAQGIDSQAVNSFISYLDCVESQLRSFGSPDECLSSISTAHAEELETVFDTLYWLPAIEPALFYQLDKYKPKDCAAAHATCTASTPGDICPPWRRVLIQDAAGASRPEASDLISVNTNDKSLIRTTHARTVEATIMAVPTLACNSNSTLGSEVPPNATTTDVLNRTRVCSGFLPQDTASGNSAAFSVLGRCHGLLRLIVPVAAGLLVAFVA